jgi:predicted SAM-dependent methyltransferase
MRELTALLLGFSIAVAAWRHIAIAMDHFYLQGVCTGMVSNPYDDESSIDNGPAEHEWHHLQASHMALVGNTT